MRIRTFRRKLLDERLRASAPLMRGRVLDIGGLREMKRGSFRPPSGAVQSWEYLNIDARTKPDYCSSAEDIPVGDDSFDTVLMNEVLEHLENPSRALAEASRVLKPGGALIISMPFLFPLHGAPYDLQRWTAARLKRELSALGMADAEITPMGGLCAVVHDLLAVALKKIGFKPVRAPLRLALRCSAPLWRLFDRAFAGSRKNITTGYFVVAKKS